LAKDLKTTAGDIAKQLDELSIRFPTKGKPVVVGFSQGAMIALELALWHPEVLGGGLVLSGYYPEQLYPTERSPESRPPLFSIHGTADEVLPIVHMRTIIAHANQLGYGIEHREYEGMAHGLDGQAHRQAMMLMERLLREQ
jgi:phospholipase/carboxylesterase